MDLIIKHDNAFNWNDEDEKRLSQRKINVVRKDTKKKASKKKFNQGGGAVPQIQSVS